jgi:hypothetical protein
LENYCFKAVSHDSFQLEQPQLHKPSFSAAVGIYWRAQRHLKRVSVGVQKRVNACQWESKEDLQNGQL